MNCTEFEGHFQPYVDGELAVGDAAAADTHVAECAGCRGLVEGERRFRQLLRRQPRESAPPEFREAIRTRLRRDERRAAARPWLVAPAAAVTAALVLALWPATRPSAPLVSELVDKHIAYAQIDQPAEFVSTDRLAVEAWFRQRAALRVTVSDYSPSGIRLVGARLADAGARKAAYVLYEKGHTLMSVFTVPTSTWDPVPDGQRVSYRGHDYMTMDRKGFHTVTWTDGHTVFGLVSMLEYAALLECADRLREDGARAARL
ncbi:MAG: anti-sigma factor family protein [Candidatus Rokuibacteriota bacterium]